MRTGEVDPINPFFQTMEASPFVRLFAAWAVPVIFAAGCGPAPNADEVARAVPAAPEFFQLWPSVEKGMKAHKVP